MFAKIRIDEVEVFNKTTTLLHIVNVDEMRAILDQIKGYIKDLLLNEKRILQNKIHLMESKIKVLMTTLNREKSGLINARRKFYKLVLGTMDQNPHNCINALNKQIIIINE